MTEKQTNLKPCPFCGGSPSIVKVDGFKPKMNYFYVHCKCGIEESDVFENKKAAIDKWNRRLSDGKERWEEA